MLLFVSVTHSKAAGRHYVDDFVAAVNYAAGSYRLHAICSMRTTAGRLADPILIPTVRHVFNYEER